MERTTFTFHEAHGRPVEDEFGNYYGPLADLELPPRRDGRAAVELVLRDGPATFVIPGACILRYDEHRLIAAIAARDRVWGDPDPTALRLRAHCLHAPAIDLGRARLVRVRDARLCRLGDETVVAAASVTPPRPFSFRDQGWIGWSDVVPLGPLLSGRVDPERLARLKAIPARRLTALLAEMKSAEREQFVRVLGPR